VSFTVFTFNNIGLGNKVIPGFLQKASFWNINVWTVFSF